MLRSLGQAKFEDVVGTAVVQGPHGPRLASLTLDSKQKTNLASTDFLHRVEISANGLEEADQSLQAAARRSHHDIQGWVDLNWTLEHAPETPLSARFLVTQPAEKPFDMLLGKHGIEMHRRILQSSGSFVRGRP